MKERPRKAAFSSGPIAGHRLPVTGRRRRSKRIDLNFMPPPLKSAEQKARERAPGAQHIHQQTSCGKAVAQSIAEKQKAGVAAGFR